MPRIAKSSLVRVLRALLTFHLIAIAWVFFRAKAAGDAVVILKKLGAHLTELPGLIAYYPFTAKHALGFGLIGLLLAVEIADERHRSPSAWPQSRSGCAGASITSSSSPC